MTAILMTSYLKALKGIHCIPVIFVFSILFRYGNHYNILCILKFWAQVDFLQTKLCCHMYTLARFFELNNFKAAILFFVNDKLETGFFVLIVNLRSGKYKV